MPEPVPWRSSTVRSLRKAVLAFFRREARAFPWRETTGWYSVLVSEIMLQQTRAETVVPYFSRWMERYPNPDALSAADPEDVLSTWQGLGYYARARRLQAAVREIVRVREGRAPATPEELRTLPGIGPYTAGAVASIAFGHPAPAVDGNVKRVLARLADSPDPSAATLEAWATALVDPQDPGGFNQGLMDLGACICVPKKPRCGRCPLARHCLAALRGTAALRPSPKRRRPLAQVVEVVVVLARGGPRSTAVLFRRRPEGGLLGGMWELPGSPMEGVGAAEAVACQLAKTCARTARLISPLARVDHAFTHRRVAYLPFVFRVGCPAVRGSYFQADGATFRWARLGVEAAAMPFSVAQRKILDAAAECLRESPRTT